jgi:hypothetical protein
MKTGKFRFINKIVLFMLLLIRTLVFLFPLNISRRGRAGFTDVEGPGQSTFGGPYKKQHI